MKTLLNFFNRRKRSENTFFKALIAMDEQLENSKQIIDGFNGIIEGMNKKIENNVWYMNRTQHETIKLV